jgi:threonine/homoserine/homoserine lactone efflux protein
LDTVPSLETLATFALVVAAFAAVPGPSNLFVVAQGLRMGRKTATLAATGCALASAVYATAAALGLAALMASSAIVLSGVHYVGGAYLVLLGVRALRSAPRATDGPSKASSAGHDVSGGHVLARGFFVELSNPKVALFFVAFLPQFVHRDDGATWSQLLILGWVFCLIGLLSDSLYALASGSIRERLGSRRRVFANVIRASGVMYLGLGAWALYSGARVESHA